MENAIRSQQMSLQIIGTRKVAKNGLRLCSTAKGRGHGSAMGMRNILKMAM